MFKLERFKIAQKENRALPDNLYFAKCRDIH